MDDSDDSNSQVLELVYDAVVPDNDFTHRLIPVLRYHTAQHRVSFQPIHGCYDTAGQGCAVRLRMSTNKREYISRRSSMAPTAQRTEAIEPDSA